MIKITAKIIDPLGLHARPASIIVSTANKFKSIINIIFNENETNLKSIIKVMSLGIQFNDIVTISFFGLDEKEACDVLKNSMENNKIIELI